MAPEVQVIDQAGADRLIRERKLDVAPVAGKWESFVIQVVPQPLPGVDSALIIAGSDKRGTIYGIYDLSEQIGVSPWYWWADVPPRRRDALFVKAGRYIQGPPTVQYRGIFLNDEAPALTGWPLIASLTVSPLQVISYWFHSPSGFSTPSLVRK